MITFSPDYRWCSIDGAEFSFTPGQARIVESLHALHLEGIHEVGSAWLLTDLELSGRLPDLFRKHPAWGRLIMPGTTRGTVRMVLDPSREIQRFHDDSPTSALDNSSRSSAHVHRNTNIGATKRNRKAATPRVTRRTTSVAGTVAPQRASRRQRQG